MRFIELMSNSAKNLVLFTLKGIIYKATNVITRMAYIGSTANTFAQRYSGCNMLNGASNSDLEADIREYGMINFKIEILDHGILDLEDLVKKEASYIISHNTLCPNGYNKMVPTEKTIMCEQTRQKLVLSCGGGIDAFIQKARKVHGFKYDYSASKYVNAKVKINIACPIHGEFFQHVDNHLDGDGCPKCGKHSSLGMNNEIFSERMVEKFGDNFELINNEQTIKSSLDKVIIKCKKHGEFSAIATSFLTANTGCPCCVAMKKKIYKSKPIGAFVNQNSQNPELVFENVGKVLKYTHKNKNFSLSRIRAAIKTGKSYRGFYWKEITIKEFLQSYKDINPRFSTYDMIEFYDRFDFWIKKSDFNFEYPPIPTDRGFSHEPIELSLYMDKNNPERPMSFHKCDF